MPESETGVHTRDLTKTFRDPKRGEVRAVERVSFDARPGEVVGLLGQNGAGKSTFLRILSTAIRPDSGAATVAGYDVVQNPTEVRAHIGFLSNSTAIYGRLSPRESLTFYGGLYGLRGGELKERVERAIARFGIGGYADGLADKLSTGQKQRVGIARAVLHDPPVLFLDEPTSGLDVVAAQDVLSFVEEVRREGKTVVYCTHIMSEAERLCDRVYAIEGGTIRGEGTVADLKAQTGEPTLEAAFLNLVGYRREAVTA